MEVLKTYSIETDIVLGALKGGKLHKEIEESGCVLNFQSIEMIGDVFNVLGSSILDENLLNNTVASHEAISLLEYKSVRYDEIDDKSGELISNGFLYNSKVFSLSSNAQINILALHETRDDPALTYPISYSTVDDLDHYDVVDSTDLHVMFLTALGTKKSYLDSGTVLKDSVRAAQNTSEVDLVVDDR